MNYVVTFTDKNCIDNILNVWIPSLKKNFSGKIVVITFDVTMEDIEKLKKENIIVIEEDKSISGLYKTIQNRLYVEEKFIKTLEDVDQIMLIDGADVVFQSEIDNFFDTMKDNKIYYSTTGTLSNKITFNWMQKLIGFRNNNQDIYIKLKKEKIVASGMLAGYKNTFLKYFENHKLIMTNFKAKYFTGINQIILTYLVITQPENFLKTNIHNCRIDNENIIKDKEIYKIQETIPIIHFSCNKMKQIYKNNYLSTIKITNEKIIKPNKLNILWLYGSNEKFDKINHWYHTDFAKIIAKQSNINLMMYGYKMTELQPEFTKIQFNEKIKGKDIKKEFDFDIIIMDNKNRFAFTQTLKERQCNKPRNFWLKPEFFDDLNNIPKIFLEGDYHLHFHMNKPEEKNWYKERKVDLLLVRHLSALKYHRDNSMPIMWFPCSVDNNIFKPNPDIKRINKICLISGYGIDYYKYRNTAGKILEPLNLIDIYSKRFIGEDYIKNLQSYVCHLSCSSIRSITPAKMFEYMASGTVLFTDAGNEYGLKELFPDRTYVTYDKKDYHDLILNAQKILNDKDFRIEITTNAIKCINEKHTHEIRAKQLINIIVKKFKISYDNIQKDSLLQNVKNLFFGKNKQISDIYIINTPPQDIIKKKEIELIKENSSKLLEQSKKEESNINLSIQNEHLLRKLYQKNICVTLLKDTCYNIIINNKIGTELKIAVNEQYQARKILGKDFIFEEPPKLTKKFKYKDMIFKVPYPIIAYLTQFKGENIVNELKIKSNQLQLINNIYEFKKRKK